jgi:hypothetical protein
MNGAKRKGAGQAISPNFKKFMDDFIEQKTNQIFGGPLVSPELLGVAVGKRGGKRKGAGRKLVASKRAITVRITSHAANSLNAYCAAKKLSQARAVEAWAIKLKP